MIITIEEWFTEGLFNYGYARHERERYLVVGGRISGIEPNMNCIGLEIEVNEEDIDTRIFHQPFVSTGRVIRK